MTPDSPLQESGTTLCECCERPTAEPVYSPDGIGNARLLWMKGHRAMARRILEDSRITDERARSAIQEHYDFTEAWIVDWEASHG